MPATYGTYRVDELHLNDRKVLFSQVMERVNGDTLVKLVQMCGGTRLPKSLISGEFLISVPPDIIEDEVDFLYIPNQNKIRKYISSL
ncbi:MAG: hypothetical protein KJ674_04235 [Nanoarchaeota archaeon]|nr:hypothetical protein [Nanoarchaeota archaeon]